MPNGKERPPARAGEDRRLRRIDRLDSDAVPERDQAFDALSELTGIWVVPGRVAVHAVTNYNVVVAGHPFPVTGRVAVARPEMLHTHVGNGKVLIALDDNGIGALGQDGTLPGCPISLGEDCFGRF